MAARGRAARGTERAMGKPARGASGGGRKVPGGGAARPSVGAFIVASAIARSPAANPAPSVIAADSSIVTPSSPATTSRPVHQRQISHAVASAATSTTSRRPRPQASHGPQAGGWCRTAVQNSAHEWCAVLFLNSLVVSNHRMVASNRRRRVCVCPRQSLRRCAGERRW